MHTRYTTQQRHDAPASATSYFLNRASSDVLLAQIFSSRHRNAELSTMPMLDQHARRVTLNEHLISLIKTNVLSQNVTCVWCDNHKTNNTSHMPCAPANFWCHSQFSCMYAWLGDGAGGHWLVRMEWRPAGWSVCLPLFIFPCTIKSRGSLLATAHLGGPGKRAVKRLWWCAWLRVCEYTNSSLSSFLDTWIVHSLHWFNWLPINANCKT